MKTTDIEGDVSVGRNATVGGKVTAQGDLRVKGSAKIEGWLEAKNIKAANKGVFADISKLEQAYPNPRNGWWAIVGTSLPGSLYIGDNGEWVATGGTGGEPIIDSDAYNEALEALQGDITAIQQNISNINSKNTMQDTAISELNTKLDTGTILPFDGFVTEEQLAEKTSGVWYQTDSVPAVFRFISSPYGYTRADYIDTSDGYGFPRKDRIFQCGSELWRVENNTEHTIRELSTWWLYRAWYYAVNGSYMGRGGATGARVEVGTTWTCPHTGRSFTATDKTLYVLNGEVVSENQAATALLTWNKSNVSFATHNLPILGSTKAELEKVEKPLYLNYFMQVWWGASSTSLSGDDLPLGTDPGVVFNCTVLREMRYVNATTGNFRIADSRDTNQLCNQLVTVLFCRVTQSTVNLSGAPLLSVESVESCITAIVNYADTDNQTTTVRLHTDALARYIAEMGQSRIDQLYEDFNIIITA